MSDLAVSVDALWVLVAASFVFLMQAGFLAFEVGCVRPKSATSVAMKNIIDWVMITLVFFLFGFGLMFGHSEAGLIGTDLFALVGLDAPDGLPLKSIFFIFQLAFAATAATIVSGAMSERTGFVAYLCISLCIGTVIYPVLGHWVWGNLYFGSNEPWLAAIGFRDFAGSTVVHSVGGWIALVGIWFIGPRMGRYDEHGVIKPMESKSVTWSAFGCFILWFGWWGFNGGSTLSLNDQVGGIIINTNLAAAAGGLSAFVHSYFFQERRDVYGKLLGGVLGGLVAITAGCDVVTPLGALAIGVIAGVVHNYAFDLLKYRLRLDDPVGAVPVHLACGIFGTLAVAIFGQQELLGMPRMQQLGVQLVGIGAAFAWTATTAFLMFKFLKGVIGLRVSPREEMDGIQIERRATPRGVEALDEDLIKELLGMAAESEETTPADVEA